MGTGNRATAPQKENGRKCKTEGFPLLIHPHVFWDDTGKLRTAGLAFGPKTAVLPSI